MKVCCVCDFTGVTLDTLSERETSETRESNDSPSVTLTEPVAEDTANSDLPCTSASSEKDEVTTTREGVSLNEGEADNIPQNISEKENEQAFHPQKEGNEIEDNKELENLNIEAALNVNVSDTLNEVEIDSTKSSVQTDNDNGDEVQSDVNKPEIASTPDNQAVNKSAAQATRGDKSETSHQIPEQLHKTKENETTTASKQDSLKQDNKVKNIGNLSPQVANKELPVITEDVRTQQIYTELSSVARESGYVLNYGAGLWVTIIIRKQSKVFCACLESILAFLNLSAGQIHVICQTKHLSKDVS